MQKFPDEVVEKLNEPIEFYNNPKGFPYVKGEDVIARLNEAFGHCWSSTTIDSREVYGQILMHVRLEVWLDKDHIVSHDGFGSAQIMTFRNTDKVVDIGNNYKSAFTNALKKAAAQFGIGLETPDDTAKNNKSNEFKKNGFNQSNPKPTFKAPSAAPSNKRQVTSSQKPPTASKAPAGGGTGLAPRPAFPGKNTDNKASLKKAPFPMPTNRATQAFPDGDDNSPITEVQLQAVENLAGMKRLAETDIISKALPDTNKTVFKQLSKAEAKKVIRYASNVK